MIKRMLKILTVMCLTLGTLLNGTTIRAEETEITSLAEKWFLANDKDSNSIKQATGEISIDEIDDTETGQWMFSNAIPTAEGNATVFISKPEGNESKPISFKVSGGSGTEEAPYTFELVYSKTPKTSGSTPSSDTPTDTESPYTVTISGGANATADPATGTQQSVNQGNDMTTVTYTAASNYKFPEDSEYYKETSGVTVTRTSDTVITVSGKPTANAEVTVPEAVSNAQEAENVNNSEDEKATLDKTLEKTNVKKNVALKSVGNGVTEYNLWVGGTRVTSANAADVLADDETNKGKVSFTPATGETPATLKLNGANITTGYPEGSRESGIYYEGADALDIVLAEGSKNSIIKSNGGFGYGIYSNSNAGVTISGTGTLTVKGSDYGIKAENNNVTINGGNVSVEVLASGISAANDVTIIGGAVSATSTFSEGHGIIGGNNVTILDGDVTASSTGSDSDGIKAYSGFVTIRGGKVVASGKTQAIIGKVKNSITGIGWTDTAGTEGQAAIDVSTDGRALNYRKVQFLAASYAVNIIDGIQNGTVSSDKEKAKQDETVTLTVAPDNGYKVGSINVSSESGTIKVTQGDSTYSFIMPNEQVWVSVAFVSSDSVARIISGETTTEYGTLEKALEAWADGTTLQLLQNVETSNQIELNNGTRIFDMNGCSLTSSANYVISCSKSAKLTIKDSSSSKNGQIKRKENGNKTIVIWLDGSSNLTLESGTITNSRRGVYLTDNSTFTMNGGTIFVDGTGVSAHATATFNMNGGTVIKNGTASSSDGLDIQNRVTVNMSGGEVSGHDKAMYVSGANVSINMSGGSLQGNFAGVYFSQNVNYRSTFIQSGGVVSGGTSSYRLGASASGSGCHHTIEVRDGHIKGAFSPSSSDKSDMFDVSLKGGVYDDNAKTSGVNYKASGYAWVNNTGSDAGTYPNAIAKGDDYVPATSISLDEKELFLTEGGATGILTATVKGNDDADPSDDSVTWTSSNPSIATVNSRGIVTPVAIGEATITAKANGAQNPDETSATCTVKVKPRVLVTFHIGSTHTAIDSTFQQTILEGAAEEIGKRPFVESVSYSADNPEQLIITVKASDVLETTTIGVIQDGIHTAIDWFLKGKPTGTGNYPRLDNGQYFEYVGRKTLEMYKSESATRETIREEYESEDIITKNIELYALWSDPIGSASVTLTSVPKCGAIAGYDEEYEYSPKPEFSIEGNMSVLEIGNYWSNTNTGLLPIPFTGKFEGGTKYYGCALLRPDLGYYFDISRQPSTYITVKGDASPRLVYQGGYSDPLLISTGATATHEWREIIEEPSLIHSGKAYDLCDGCGAEKDVKPIAKVNYNIVSGNGNVWTKGSNTTSDFRFARTYNSEFDDYKEIKTLSKVEVDNKVLTKDQQYTTEAGSVWVKLKPSYLETLSTGKHTLKVTFTETYPDDRENPKASATVTATFTVNNKSSGGGSTPKKDNVVTCQMAGFPANYAWNEAAKACQPGYLDAGGNFHPYRTVRRSNVPNTSDNGNLTMYTIAMFLMTFVAYITAKKLTEDSRA